MLFWQLKKYLGEKNKALSKPFTIYRNKFQTDHRFKHKNFYNKMVKY